jgi:hypothetical protein
MFAKDLIEDGSFATDGAGFGFAARLNWYRALPLSSIGLSVRVDGEPVAEDAISFAVDGERFPLEELPRRHDRMWFVADSAQVRVDAPGGLPAGPHELSVTIASRIPYIPTRPPDVLIQEDTCTKTVLA